MIKVSVIVPVYNKEKYLKQCIDSITGQTCQEIEIICIDDASTDASLSILRRIADTDARVHIICQKNAGAAAARNMGIQQAAGEYLMFMDADDYYPSPDILMELYQAAKREGAVLCGGSFSECHPDGSVRTHWSGMLKGYTFVKDGRVSYKEYQFDYGFHRFMYCTQFLVKNSIYFPNYQWFEDPPFLVRTMICAGWFYAVKKITYCYRWGHQKLRWNQRRVNDLVQGLMDNMRAAEENGLSELLYLCCQRMSREYYDTIKRYMTKDNVELIHLLIRAGHLLDYSCLLQDTEILSWYRLFMREHFFSWALSRIICLRSAAVKIYYSKMGIFRQILGYFRQKGESNEEKHG